MNESKKELAQYLKLNYGLHYKNKNFVPSQTVVDGKLELEKYTDQILIYEPIQDNSSNNTWDLFANTYDIKNDDDSLEFEKIQDKLPLLAKKDVKLLIPVLRITYFGNVKSSIVRENYQEFLAREVLVGGFLIIRDALLDNSLEFDWLKAHISWAINEARWECKNLLKSAIMHSKVENIEDSNGNPINDIKTLTDYLNQLYKFETPTIISYEKVAPIEQKMNDSLFNVRLIPGITNHHKEITMECWTQDNIYLNLPFWIKEYQLNHGMVVTSYGLVPGIKPALDFLSVPSIKRKRKIRLKASFIRNELLHSKIYIDESNLENFPFLTLFDTAPTNVIQCNIFHEEVVINIWEKQKQISEPSQQLVEDIKCALNDINPYKSLEKVFSEYGHVISTEITMGGRLGLGDSTVNEKAQEKFHQYLNGKEWSEWSDTIILECKDLLKKLNMSDQKLIAYNNSETNLNELNTWLNNTSEKPNSWSLVDQPKLISLYEIFHEDIKKQIQNLLENKQKILMTGVTKLSSSKIRYYRVEFENYLLTSDDYQIIGSIIVNNERFDDLSVKFHMKSISGFSIIIKEYKKLDKEIKGDLKVVWQLIGKPKSVGYFSKHTRNNEVFNTEFVTEIPEQKISLQIDVKEELSPDFIIATSIQYPPTNYEYMLQVVVKSWSGKIIDLDIINFDSFDDTPDKACIQLYVINPNQQESVIADFGSEQVLWKLIGQKLGSGTLPDIRVVVGLDFGTTYSGDLSDELKPKLPVCYKKAITDYLREIGKFTTETEAAAIYCMETNLKEQALAHPGTNFMIVDCGGVLPTAAISRGATMYGLSIISKKSVISSRILKYTYGVDMLRKWEYGDPINRKLPEGFIVKFQCLARRGTKMNIDQVTRVPILKNQENMLFKIYYTREYDAEYCDDPGMKLLGELIVSLPGSGLHRSILIELTFGKMELIATLKNELTGQSGIATFNFNLDTTATPNLVLNELVEQYNQSENDYKKSGSDKPKDDIINDTRILVAIDFGTTYSSFAYVHKENQETVVVNYSWPGKEGVPKAPTALQYDEEYKNVTSWGNLALEEDPDGIPDNTEGQRPRPVELFKFHISNLSKKELPWLPPQLHYTKAIEDYLTQMRKLIQVTLVRRWPTINFPQQVGFVLTIPAEWPPHTTKVMRECAYKAGLLTSLNSQRLEFTTEPEAAALHCLSVIKEHNLQPNADCGGGTVDLTLRKLLPENNLPQYVVDEIKEQMEEAGWILKVDYETVKGINVFVPIIAVPAVPIAAIVRGAITYGLNVIDIVPDRVLKWTYGIAWVSGDKLNKRTKDGMYLYFHELARRGSNVKQNIVMIPE
ncbi:unnamed protein product [Rhizophagus irregularis]|uniref:Hsp70 family protein n=1 Tax=Rhizophagus irregularis TaxID=588596 RepID=A0A916EEL6_9GLOM|nr:unnamed protein product [Rhizophagus irregularis]